VKNEKVSDDIRFLKKRKRKRKKGKKYCERHSSPSLDLIPFSVWNCGWVAICLKRKKEKGKREKGKKRKKEKGKRKKERRKEGKKERRKEGKKERRKKGKKEKRKKGKKEKKKKGKGKKKLKCSHALSKDALSQLWRCFFDLTFKFMWVTQI